MDNVIDVPQFTSPFRVKDSEVQGHFRWRYHFTPVIDCSDVVWTRNLANIMLSAIDNPQRMEIQQRTPI